MSYIPFPFLFLTGYYYERKKLLMCMFNPAIILNSHLILKFLLHSPQLPVSSSQLLPAHTPFQSNWLPVNY